MTIVYIVAALSIGGGIAATCVVQVRQRRRWGPAVTGPRQIMNAVLACAMLLAAVGVARISAEPTRPSNKPKPAAVVHRVLTRAQARAEVEAAGRSWPDLLAQTTDRPTYDAGFIQAWLNQPRSQATP